MDNDLMDHYICLMRYLKQIVFCFFIPVLCIWLILPLFGEITFREMISRRIKGQLAKPKLLTCLPKSKRDDTALEKEIAGALEKKYPDVKKGDIAKIIFTQKDWRIERNEFTGIVQRHYHFVYVLYLQNGKDRYYLVEVIVMQNGKYFGFAFGDTYVKNVLSVDFIKEADIDKVCP